MCTEDVCVCVLGEGVVEEWKKGNKQKTQTKSESVISLTAKITMLDFQTPQF